MKADPLGRQAAQRVVERLDPHHDELLVVGEVRLGGDHVPAGRGRRVVELEDEARVDDRLVFLAHHLGAGVEELLVARVMAVADAIGAAWGDRGDEALRDPGSGERRLQVGDVGLERGVAGIAQRRDADRASRRPRPHRHP